MRTLLRVFPFSWLIVLPPTAPETITHDGTDGLDDFRTVDRVDDRPQLERPLAVLLDVEQLLHLRVRDGEQHGVAAARSARVVDAGRGALSRGRLQHLEVAEHD